MRLFCTVFLTAILSARAFADSISVAAAISLKEAMTEVAAIYKAQSGVDIEFTFGSSGQLATQIQNGAPVDVFISAANKQVDDLVKSGAVDASSRRVVAGNSLVLVGPAEAQNTPATLGALDDPSVKRVAIGEPRSVPAGQYAMQAIQHAGIEKVIHDKLIFGTNVRQVLDYVERGEVSAGIVYSTDARQSGEKVRVLATVEARLHEPIVYPAVIVKMSRQPGEAAKFIEFVCSEKGQAALHDFGFTPPVQSRQ